MKSNKDVTIYDVAKALDISPSTVSRGLKGHPNIREETRNKIKEQAHKTGYQSNKFACSLRKRRTETIGVVILQLNNSEAFNLSTVVLKHELIVRESTLKKKQAEEI